MLVITVPLQEAQRVKEDLLSKGVLDPRYEPAKEGSSMSFPITKRFDTPYTLEEKELQPREHEQPTTLREALIDKLPQEVLERVKTTYDQVGDIAILEIDEDLKEYEQTIGETLLQKNSQVATVLAKDSSHEGVYRTQKMRLLAGEDKRLADHKENGVVLKINVEEVYYSARLSTERKRIAELVRQGEDVLVLFSGCGPYTCVIAKNTKARSVTGIEINPAGHALAEENAKRNKLVNVTNLCGDVREVVPTLTKTYDRVLMPLPKSAETFLDVGLIALKPGGTLHFYAFLHEDEFGKAKDWIAQECARSSRAYEFLSVARCGQQSPRVYRICVDTKIH